MQPVCSLPDLRMVQRHGKLQLVQLALPPAGRKDRECRIAWSGGSASEHLRHHCSQQQAVVADEDRVDEPDEQTAKPNVIAHDDGESLAVAAKTRMTNPVRRSLEHPHACITLLDAATWGSADPSEITETDVPPTENDDDVLTLVDENQSDEEFFIDDEWVVHGGSTAPMSVPLIDEVSPT